MEKNWKILEKAKIWRKENFVIFCNIFVNKTQNWNLFIVLQFNQLYKWEAIDRKQITRWQHVSQLKASSFGSW